MPRGKCVFNQAWLDNEKYKCFLQKDNTSKFKAKCSLCDRCFDISNMGEPAIASHMAGKKHISLLEAKMKKAVNLSHYFQKQTPCSAAVETSASCSGNLDNSVSKNDVLKAEILWCLKVISSHYSYKSCENMQSVLSLMCPDSNIAKKFSCGEKKCSYYCVYGIAPYFSSLLRERVKSEDGYVLLFDETLNKVTQSKQLDTHVRFWDSNKVITRYLSSDFLGHATSDVLCDKIQDQCSNFGFDKLHQLSMDGPNVNWKVYDLLMNKLKLEDNASLLNIGSCGLHVIHNAFNDGCKMMPELAETAQALHYIFKDSPARREDFTQVTNCSIFPSKFCKHRWLENVSVFEITIEILPSVLIYINTIKQKKLPRPQCKSFDVVFSNVQDPLFLAKCNFFVSVAKNIEYFLTIYQTDQPMVPFMANDLYNLLKELMERFVKDAIIRGVKNPVQLLNIDISEENCKDASKVVLGFVANKLVAALSRGQTVNDKKIMEFRINCKKMLIQITKKIVDKSPLQYSLIRLMACLDPRECVRHPDKSIHKLNKILVILVNNKKIVEAKCDAILKEYTDLVYELSSEKKLELESFHPGTQRLDVFYYDIVSEKYKALWEAMKILLLLSHGQATVERGFSTNMQITADNMKDDSFRAKRIIVDHINSVGQIKDVELSKELLQSVAGARQRYVAHLEELKKIKNKKVMTEKRKLLLDDIEDLKSKKKRLEIDISELKKASEDFAEQAETKSSLSLLAKSNALRHSAKEKEKTLLLIDSELCEKVLAHKNC